MIKELRKMRAKGGKERAKANYISGLQYKGVIGTYYSKSGYLGYDTEELAKYKATVKKGRPSRLDIKGEKV